MHTSTTHPTIPRRRGSDSTLGRRLSDHQKLTANSAARPLRVGAARRSIAWLFPLTLRNWSWTWTSALTRRSICAGSAVRDAADWPHRTTNLGRLADREDAEATRAES